MTSGFSRRRRSRTVVATFSGFSLADGDNGFAYFLGDGPTTLGTNRTGLFRGDAGGNVVELYPGNEIAGQTYRVVFDASVENGNVGLVAVRGASAAERVTDLIVDFGTGPTVIASKGPSDSGAPDNAGTLGTLNLDLSVGGDAVAITTGVDSLSTSIFYYDAATGSPPRLLVEPGDVINGTAIDYALRSAVESEVGDLVAVTTVTDGLATLSLVNAETEVIDTILAPGDVLDGRLVLGAFTASTGQFVGDQLAVNVVFDDGNGGLGGFGLYTITVPEPATAGLAMIGVGGLTIRRRR